MWLLGIRRWGQGRRKGTRRGEARRRTGWFRRRGPIRDVWRRGNCRLDMSVSQWDLGIKDGQPGQRPCSSASPSWDAREAKPLRLTKRRRFAGLQGIPSRMNTVALFSVLRRRSAMRTMAMDSSVVQFLTSPHCLMYFLYILGLKENVRIDDPRRREQGQREGKLTMHQNRTHLS
jgi:hypothetical protein